MLDIDRGKLAELCSKHGIRKLSLFGSVLRGEHGPNSDVDLLVEFEPGRVIGFFEVAEAESDFSVFFGRRADIRTERDLSRHFRDRVVSEASELFAAA